MTDKNTGGPLKGIKVLELGLSEDETKFRAFFTRERKALAALQHQEHAVRVVHGDRMDPELLLPREAFEEFPFQARNRTGVLFPNKWISYDQHLERVFTDSIQVPVEQGLGPWWAFGAEEGRGRGRSDQHQRQHYPEYR